MPTVHEFANKYPTGAFIAIRIAIFTDYATATLRYGFKGFNAEKNPPSANNQQQAIQQVKNILHSDKYVPMEARNDAFAFLKTLENPTNQPCKSIQ